MHTHNFELLPINPLIEFYHVWLQRKLRVTLHFSWQYRIFDVLWCCHDNDITLRHLNLAMFTDASLV